MTSKIIKQGSASILNIKPFFFCESHSNVAQPAESPGHHVDPARLEREMYEKEFSLGEKAKTEGLNHFLDVPVRIAIELAKRGMKMRDILQLRANSIVELPKSAGESVDILMNGQFVASGEIVALDHSTGIRMTHLKTEI